MNNQAEKGQGIVEYALILVLIAVVVIAALTLMGPRVSTVFGTVNGSLAAGGAAAPTAVPSPTACIDPTNPACGFTSCANDYGNCLLSGTHTVMYGKNPTFVTVTVTGPFTCLPQGYSGAYPILPVPDPLPGIVKTCYYK